VTTAEDHHGRSAGVAAQSLLVLHDDADREFAYTAGSEDALDRARTHGWTTISIKNDWTTVFTDPQLPPVPDPEVAGSR
jgi:hypothetical protein